MLTKKTDKQSTGNMAIITKRSKFFRDLNRSKYLLLLALPTFIYMVIFKYLPMYGIIISLFDYNAYLGLSRSKFVWFEHFYAFFNNVDFLKILKNTVLLGVNRLVWCFPAPILLALVLNEVRNIRFKKIVQTISYLPYFVSVSVVAGMTVMLLNPTSGLVNIFITALGGEPIYFMSKPELFRPIYIITEIWQGAGYGSIVYLAAIAAIDPTLYESAVLDGANKLKQIIYITLPGIAQTLIVMLILNTGHITSISFDKAFLLQNPLIMSTADVLSTYIYRYGVKSTNYSYATAAGLFNSVISVVFVYTSNTISKKIGDNNLF